MHSSVDELYRFALGLDVPATWRDADYAKGWTSDTYRGAQRLSAYATPDTPRS